MPVRQRKWFLNEAFELVYKIIDLFVIKLGLFILVTLSIVNVAKSLQKVFLNVVLKPKDEIE